MDPCSMLALFFYASRDHHTIQFGPVIVREIEVTTTAVDLHVVHVASYYSCSRILIVFESLSGPRRRQAEDASCTAVPDFKI